MISGSTKWRKKTDIKFRYRHKKGPKGPFFHVCALFQTFKGACI